MANVNDPREVIDFLRKDENKYIFGEGRDITGKWYAKDRHGVCVQLRQFFGKAHQGVTLHYEIEEYDNGINVEIQSETKTPSNVYAFIKSNLMCVSKRVPTGRIALQRLKSLGKGGRLMTL